MLQQKWPQARLFDPEEIGYALQKNLSDFPFTDFQELPPWRTLVVAAIDVVSRFTSQDVIAVQSVLRPDYWLEIRSGLAARGHSIFHVVIEADREALIHRIQNDDKEPGASDWRMSHIPEYERASQWMRSEADLVLNATHHSPELISDHILTALGEANTSLRTPV